MPTPAPITVAEDAEREPGLLESAAQRRDNARYQSRRATVPVNDNSPIDATPAEPVSEDPAVRRFKVIQGVREQAKAQFAQEHPFAPSGSDVAVPQHMLTSALQESERAAQSQAIQARRSQIAALKGANTVDEAKYRSAGQQFYTDPNGRIQPLIENGRQLYHPTPFEEGVHPQTGEPTLQMRDRYGQRQYKTPPVIADPDPLSGRLFYQMPSGQKEIGSAEALLNHPDIRIAKQARVAFARQRVAQAHEAMNPIQEHNQAIQSEFQQANERGLRLENQLTDIKAQLEDPKLSSDQQTQLNIQKDGLTNLIGGLAAQVKKGTGTLWRKAEMSKAAMIRAKLQFEHDAHGEVASQRESYLRNQGATDDQISGDSIYQNALAEQQRRAGGIQQANQVIGRHQAAGKAAPVVQPTATPVGPLENPDSPTEGAGAATPAANPPAPAAATVPIPAPATPTPVDQNKFRAEIGIPLQRTPEQQAARAARMKELGLGLGDLNQPLVGFGDTAGRLGTVPKLADIPRMPGDQIRAGALNSLGKAAAGLTSPTNLTLLALTGGMGKVVGRLIAGGFGVKMLKDAYDQTPEAWRLLHDPKATTQAKTEAIGDVAINFLLGAGALKHAATRGPAGPVAPEPGATPPAPDLTARARESLTPEQRTAEEAKLQAALAEGQPEPAGLVQEPTTPAQKSALAIHQGLKDAETLRQAPEGGKLLKAQLTKEAAVPPPTELQAVADARAEGQPLPAPGAPEAPAELGAVAGAREGVEAAQAGREIAGAGVSPEAQGRAEIAAREAAPVNIGPRDSTVSTGTGVPTAKEKTMLAEQQRLVDEHLAQQKQPTEEPTNAIREQSPAGILQRPSERTGETGGERGRMEQGQQGAETPRAQEAPPAIQQEKGARGEPPPRGAGEPGGGAQGAPGKEAVREEVAPALLDTGEKKPPAQMTRAERIAELQAAGIKEVNGKPLTGDESANPAEIINAVGKLRRGKPDLTESTPAEKRTSDKWIEALQAAKKKIDPTIVGANAQLYETAHNGAIDLAILAIRAGRSIADVIKLATDRFKARFPDHTPEHLAKLESDIRAAAGEPEPAKATAAKEAPSQPSVSSAPKAATTTGIAHRVSEAAGIAAERGEGISAKESTIQGREKYTPEKALDSIKEFEADPKHRVSEEAFQLAKAHKEALAKATDAAADKHGYDSPEAKAGRKAEEDWIARIKPLQTEWHKGGQAQQGETEIDTGTFHGLARAVRESTGKDLTEKQATDAKRISTEVKGATEAVDTAKDKLIKEVDAGPKTADSVAKAEKLVRGVKPGEKWTPEEAKALWHLAKENYLNKGVTDFSDIRNKMATDLGLPVKDITEGLASPKGARVMTNDMYAKMSEQRQVINQAKQWVADAKYPGYERFFRAIPSAFFNLATFGHGTVWTVTHAGNQYFLPKATGPLFRDLGRSFKLMGVTDKGAYHERMMQDLVRDPNFITAKRAGLANDPFKYQDEYQNANVVKLFKEIGLMGNRGFDGMKLFRQFRFNQEWNGMPESLKTPEGSKLLADAINKATGITKSSKLPAWTNTAFFAPKLEMSRWAFLYGDPIKSAKTIAHSVYDKKSVTPEATHAAYRDLRQKATMAGVYMAALGLNQALLAATGSKQEVNFTEPKRGDWLSFKALGHNIGIVSPMINSVRFLQNLAHDFWGERSKLEQLQNSRAEEAGVRAVQYARGKLSPFAGIALDVASQSDAVDRPMPWSTEPISYRAKRMGATGPYTYGEYGSKKMLPIPLEEVATDVWRNQGASEDSIQKWLRAITIGAVAGGTGARITPEMPAYVPKEKASPFSVTH